MGEFGTQEWLQLLIPPAMAEPLAVALEVRRGLAHNPLELRLQLPPQEGQATDWSFRSGIDDPLRPTTAELYWAAARAFEGGGR